MNSYRDHQVLMFDRPGKIRKKTLSGVASTHSTLVRPRVNITYPFFFLMVGLGPPSGKLLGQLSFFLFFLSFFDLGGKRMATPLGN